MADTRRTDLAERHIEAVRQQGGLFVEAVRVTRMPMLVTDATLPGNPIIFANKAFIDLSGYTIDELLGQDPHFMNGERTDPEAIRAIRDRHRRRAGTRRWKSCSTERTARHFGRCCSPAPGRRPGHASPTTSSPTSTSPGDTTPKRAFGRSPRNWRRESRPEPKNWKRPTTG